MIANNISTNENIIDWINTKSVPFNYQTNILPRRIYFLYAFLGDGYEIKKPEYLNNLIKWEKSHSKKSDNNHNPSWAISILRRRYDQLDSFVKEHFSWFWLSYQQYPKNIQRCDVIRYMLMYQYGGVYSDLDVTPNFHLDRSS